MTLLVEDIEMGWDDQNTYKDRSCELSEIGYFNLFMWDWMDGKRIRFEETEFDHIRIYVQEVVHVAMDANREI